MPSTISSTDTLNTCFNLIDINVDMSDFSAVQTFSCFQKYSLISASDCYMMSSTVSSKILETMAIKEGFNFEVFLLNSTVFRVYDLARHTQSSVVPRSRFLGDTGVPLPLLKGAIYKFWGTHQIFQIFTC